MKDDQMNVVFHYTNGTTYHARNVSFIDIGENNVVYNVDQGTFSDDTVFSCSSTTTIVQTKELLAVEIRSGRETLIHRMKKQVSLDVQVSSQKHLDKQKKAQSNDELSDAMAKVIMSMYRNGWSIQTN